MPIFNFKCNKCNKTFEEFVKGTEEIFCICGSNDVEKLFTPSASQTIFKGSDWTPKKYHNTTSNIRDHVAGMKQDLGDIKSSDIYNVSMPASKD